ncbi:MAG: anthranilate phosphoribosyltransferase [Clostridia bacterium]|nr:anthranilate phosphoribosyltransferase [Clostridia bacterium]
MLNDILKKLVEGNDLNQEECGEVFARALEGSLEYAYLGAFLIALKIKGESIDEIYAGAKALRENAIHPDFDGRDMIDTCGTGGDGFGTYNVSTASAFICAAAGAGVAKHGNRSISSKCGSFDVLEALGCNINLDSRQTAESVRLTGMGFMYAPLFHKAMKNVAPVRKALGIRTIFNILGPLANPAGAGRQLLGVFSRELMKPMAEVLGKFGIIKALVVHGSDGMDEITVKGSTYVLEINEGTMSEFEIEPAMFGFDTYDASAVSGGTAAQNAEIIKSILAGREKGAKLALLAMNSGAALYAAGLTEDIAGGVQMSLDIIESGLAYKKLEQYIRISNTLGRN